MMQVRILVFVFSKICFEKLQEAAKPVPMQWNTALLVLQGTDYTYSMDTRKNPVP